MLYDPDFKPEKYQTTPGTVKNKEGQAVGYYHVIPGSEMTYVPIPTTPLPQVETKVNIQLLPGNPLLELTPAYPTTAEQAEVLGMFMLMLREVTADGGRKRAKKEKPSWKVDPSHEAAIFSHLNKWKHGEKKDPDSGVHPLVHLAWRALAIAFQEMNASDGAYINGLRAKKAPDGD